MNPEKDYLGKLVEPFTYKVSNLLEEVKSLRSRLAEVEKERDEAYARGEMDGSLKYVKFGCGHVNQGACSQCLGHVTNERNALRLKLEALDAALGKKES